MEGGVKNIYKVTLRLHSDSAQQFHIVAKLEDVPWDLVLSFNTKEAIVEHELYDIVGLLSGTPALLRILSSFRSSNSCPSPIK